MLKNIQNFTKWIVLNMKLKLHSTFYKWLFLQILQKIRFVDLRQNDPFLKKPIKVSSDWLLFLWLQPPGFSSSRLRSPGTERVTTMLCSSPKVQRANLQSGSQHCRLSVEQTPSRLRSLFQKSFHLCLFWCPALKFLIGSEPFLQTRKRTELFVTNATWPVWKSSSQFLNI